MVILFGRRHTDGGYVCSHVIVVIVVKFVPKSYYLLNCTTTQTIELSIILALIRITFRLPDSNLLGVGNYRMCLNSIYYISAESMIMPLVCACKIYD